MRRSAVLATIAMLACGPRPRPAARPSHDATLFYATTTIDVGSRGLPLPLPLVRGTVAGHATTMIVDTGAHVPVVASWLARDARLSVGGSFEGRDAAGRRVPMRRTDRPSFTIDGWGAAPDRPTAIADLPDAFRRVGIGAIVSPQALTTADEVVVLDLAAGRMRLAREAPPSRAFTLPGTRVCTYEANGVRARSLVAAVTIDGAEVALDLDTGANGIAVGRDTDVGRALAARPTSTRATGLGAAGEFDAARVDGVRVRFGEFETETAVAVVAGAADARCKTAGRIGIDYLRTCVLVIGRDALHVSCEPPAVSTGDPTCDACLLARCREPAAACRMAPARCSAFAACAGRCADRPCFEDCAARFPEGMRLNRCLGQSCPSCVNRAGSDGAEGRGR